MRAGLRIPITSRYDVDEARREARAAASELGFTRQGIESIALAVTELAHNLARYARGGEILLSPVRGLPKAGLQVESRDKGPGIEEIDRAMIDGYSTGGGLGSGLPAVKRLMDEFKISSNPDGTTIVTRKWTRVA